MLGYAAVLIAGLVAAATGAPSPQPSPYREIGRVRASSFCTAVREMMLPLAAIAESNERDFYALASPVAQFQSGKGMDAVDDVGQAANAALMRGIDDLQAVLESDAVAARDPLANDQDSENTFTGQRNLAAARIDAITGRIIHSLGDAGKVMTASWKAYPGRDDAGINVLRQRMQNIMDLQRALANRFDDVAGVYFSNRGVAGLNRRGRQGSYKSFLDSLVDALIAQDAAATKALAASAPPAPGGDVNTVKGASATAVAVELGRQEAALALEGPQAVRFCNSAPSPQPSGTP